jgi:hypothetical protein
MTLSGMGPLTRGLSPRRLMVSQSAGWMAGSYRGHRGKARWRGYRAGNRIAIFVTGAANFL